MGYLVLVCQTGRRELVGQNVSAASFLTHNNIILIKYKFNLQPTNLYNKVKLIYYLRKILVFKINIQTCCNKIFNTNGLVIIKIIANLGSYPSKLYKTT